MAILVANHETPSTADQEETLNDLGLKPQICLVVARRGRQRKCKLLYPKYKGLQ